MDQSRDRGISYMEIEGFAPSLPSPGAEWVRLKGLLRVPVALIMDSPVYVLPLRKGASVLIPFVRYVLWRYGDAECHGRKDKPHCRVNGIIGQAASTDAWQDYRYRAYRDYGM